MGYYIIYYTCIVLAPRIPSRSIVYLVSNPTNKYKIKLNHFYCRTSNGYTFDMSYKFLYFFFLFLIYTTYECDIWKAADCPQGPSKGDEDLMKSHLYTEEQLTIFCDASKEFADCVNEHLLCCDMRTEYAAALASLDVQLKRNAIRAGRYCSEFNETNPIQYKCRTTLQTIPGTRYRTTMRTIPVCNLEKAGTICSPIIENRVRFDRRWSAHEKTKWCRDAYEYHKCALSYITNCTITPVAADVAQMNVFLDYIEKSANRECPGGLYGSENEKNTSIKNDFNSLFFCSPKNNAHLACNQLPKKTQDYFPFRSATYQQLNNYSQTASVFIKRQINIFDRHPGRFFLKKTEIMNNRSNVQEYWRYRDSQNNGSTQTSIFVNKNIHIPSYLQISKRNENEYSRHRSAHCSISRSITRVDKPLKTHYKSRTLVYDKEAKRFLVPDDKVSWNVDFPDYKPVEYTTTKIQRNPKADSSDPSTITKFNQLDNKIDRRSFTGFYYIDPITQRPRNPIGRTGMTGRGRLYHWGPNHAGDPVVTRWKRDENGAVVYRQLNAYSSLKPVLEFVSIKRHDTKQWAIPGGMVDPGENVSETVRREFQEEAASDGIDPNNIKKLFTNGYKLYESYADDPRNTDNAWMETVAMHFHDDTGVLTDSINLHAGDDAEQVVWCEIHRALDLYASHKEFVKAAVDRLDAFW
ncbi:unnamed protein product [Rotaria socialis]|uniref:Nudix hydrolase domain-containing protein n=1 Tax=Rotaria socialis TaxID=392032 RepID=A0A818RE95_9BILA|nr:unnamed protein product [Rotaria socialis]CAF3587152.1 unnamed protein product [Rotaria socialis]CAF3651576.1 unnamed protein product [Rotaria socialis]CAF3734852.1 unnamed protein product [Rotaria socialis]